MEAAVLRHYDSLVLPAGFADTIRRKLEETLADEERGARLLRGQLSARLSALDSKEKNLLDLAADGGRAACMAARSARVSDTEPPETDAANQPASPVSWPSPTTRAPVRSIST